MKNCEFCGKPMMLYSELHGVFYGCGTVSQDLLEFCENYWEASDINNVLLGIKDRFHPEINGGCEPEVRSDNDSFSDTKQFLDWCRQHGACFSDIYAI